jgi:hypothetical protein
VCIDSNFVGDRRVKKIGKDEKDLGKGPFSVQSLDVTYEV